MYVKTSALADFCRQFDISSKTFTVTFSLEGFTLGSVAKQTRDLGLDSPSKVEADKQIDDRGVSSESIAHTHAYRALEKQEGGETGREGHVRNLKMSVTAKVQRSSTFFYRHN